ncbi:hypothetical protein FCN80_10235 [Martelella alba]|uniref:Uncharacterized protein n=2 Tax=Martelella alba TaxID=2590451 RepID=A0ABY2SLJ5_9HYPH|nr:hypothetical protein FCN80_10235 [Martelella alba]
MPKPPAERKAAQRARAAAAGIHAVEIHLSDSELEMLRCNCALRRPGREPYSADEYLEMLLLQDNAALELQMAQLSKRRCGKCGDPLTITQCCHDGDSQCWVTRGWHETALKAS